ncbi:helix-turn-helix domain-containing protein (plasmid) [Streptomyces sp. HU2014]|uniref:helix-turn-helix domain-containing protein n=1 Tax=Streptomyces sp. HU2014 TaxID=2939414 RepID=UPI00200C6C01|nr:helix-turn-helix domain-containing protein [Streptomyces sp. HU2014]UQI49713.1 helix-turn-helix domain-containing protein [Streptomyces sp. HU2014]
MTADSYSWMQAVHWIDSSAVLETGRTHGPRWGHTTLRVAQLLAELSPCRPGVAYLARRLKASERTIQYHLQLLREAGLLAYVVKGSRVRGERPQASEFARTIPPAFDTALGIRTTGEGVRRRATGIAEHGRAAMARLARKAAGRVRKPRSRLSAKATETTSLITPRCTPMEGTTSRSSSTGCSTRPSESELARGKNSSASLESKLHKKRRTLNKVGRRHQLAFELVQQVPWLGRAAVPRVAWVARHIADAGWTVTEVIAWLDVENVAQRVYRPSAFLAHRLKGAHLLLDTPAKRAACVTAWRDCRRSTRQRHLEWRGDWQAPSHPAVRQMVAGMLSTCPQERQGEEIPALQAGEDGLVDLEQLSREEVIDLRAAAEKDPELIRITIQICGEPYARRLYTHRLVERIKRLDTTSRLIFHAFQERA